MIMRPVPLIALALATSSLAFCGSTGPAEEPPLSEEALAAVKDGEARLAMIPIENSVAGRVADIHHLLPGSGLYIIGEHFLPIRFQLMGVKGATLGGLKSVQSHVMALGFLYRLIELNLRYSPPHDPRLYQT